MIKEKPVKEIVLQEAENLKFADTWRIDLIDNESFIICFGSFVKEDEVQVISKIKIPIQMLGQLTESLLNFTYTVNKEFNLDMELFKNVVQVIEQEEKIDNGGNA